MEYLHILTQNIVDIIQYEYEHAYDTTEIDEYGNEFKEKIYRKMAECICSGLQLIVWLDRGFFKELTINNDNYKRYRFLVLTSNEYKKISMKRYVHSDDLDSAEKLYSNYLDIKRYFNILFLFMTNYYDDVDPHAVDRYDEIQEIEISNLDSDECEYNRILIINIFKHIYNMHVSNKRLISITLQNRICSDCVSKIMTFIV